MVLNSVRRHILARWKFQGVLGARPATGKDLRPRSPKLPNLAVTCLGTILQWFVGAIGCILCARVQLHLRGCVLLSIFLVSCSGHLSTALQQLKKKKQMQTEQDGGVTPDGRFHIAGSSHTSVLC